MKKFPVAKSICESCLTNIALFSAKMEKDFLCMLLIIRLVVQIICLLNVGRNWLKMILPATDGKTFSRVHLNIMFLFFLVFNLKSYYFLNNNQGSRREGLDP